MWKKKVKRVGGWWDRGMGKEGRNSNAGGGYSKGTKGTPDLDGAVKVW